MQSVHGDIVECGCGLRYVRTQSTMVAHQTGAFACACGEELGSWDGLYRVLDESEDGPPTVS